MQSRAEGEQASHLTGSQRFLLVVCVVQYRGGGGREDPEA